MAMCYPIAILAAVAAVGAVATVVQAQQQKKAANQQAALVAQQGAEELDAAKARAEKIRRAGRAQRGEAKAALAAAGVKLGEGSALEIDSTIDKRSEEDALSEILSGRRANRSASVQSDLLRQSGENAVTNSYFSAASTALGAYSKGGWASTAKAA